MAISNESKDKLINLQGLSHFYDKLGTDGLVKEASQVTNALTIETGAETSSAFDGSAAQSLKLAALDGTYKLPTDYLYTNVANGIAKLDADGLIPSSILPSYVDDIVEVAAYTDLPATGESDKIYVVTTTGHDGSALGDTPEVYRWSGSAYVQINASVSVAERVAHTLTVNVDGVSANNLTFDGSANVTINKVNEAVEANHVANALQIKQADGKYASFNGSTAVTVDNIETAKKVSSVLTVTDKSNSAVTFDGSAAASVTSVLEAGTADKVANAITFDIDGVVANKVTFDGSQANVEISKIKEAGKVTNALTVTKADSATETFDGSAAVSISSVATAGKVVNAITFDDGTNTTTFDGSQANVEIDKIAEAAKVTNAFQIKGANQANYTSYDGSAAQSVNLALSDIMVSTDVATNAEIDAIFA